MTDPLDPESLAKLAFGLYPHVFQSGEKHVSGESIAARIKRIRVGLEPENEFFAIVSWLGHCSGIFKIGQTPMPIERNQNDLRAPEFIAFSSYQNRRVPLLIEVKTTNKNKLVWSKSYFDSLKAFAGLLGLPLLIAWKWNGIWLLCDVAHFQKRVTSYHLDYKTALKQNLMSLLFGNVHITMAEAFCLELHCLILDPKPPPEFR